MNELQIFNSEEFGDIRTVTIENEPWFVGKDVATALGYADTFGALKKHIMDEDKLVCQIDSAGQKRDVTVINESGLYALIFGSKLESARRFKHWVTSEVLPAIRKTGSYQKPMTTDQKIQLLAQGNVELTEKIDKVDKDLQEFKADMPLLALECQRITRAKNQKVVPLMGGKDAPAYKNKSLMHKVYSDVDAQLRREFGVNTYKAIKRSQCDLAVEIIKKYELPRCLREEIEDENSQMCFAV
ncbi:ORF6C domain-containing protein [Dorea longicatena]|uniref:ORF6C domain-containing protein n=1 Tax=Dorea longicatena TaxID=88431 RepID=UPI0022DF22BA|nr:ORF6C domain-containing protein [Dorea longicatena]